VDDSTRRTGRGTSLKEVEKKAARQGVNIID
jgi:hypothetical protein